MTDLLIITCSKAKNNLQNSPAIEVYNGNKYRILRKRQPKDLKIVIISAKYGMITPETRISWYDQLMTKSRAYELREPVSSKLTEVIKENHFESIYLDLPDPYLLTLDLSTAALIIWDAQDFHYATGPRGPRLHQFSEWLKEREVTV